ncbi:2OG-Fe dioxygenase family protein [Neisseria dentiae]|nr:2OG-Fe dioxygenase family protein [Neisseria dentiae]MCQ9327474.1 2OG-Fe dioxygenase family protein [Neisseria dentiae]
MAMVKRNNVQGGETTIYDLDKQPLAQFTLMDTLDIAIVDDTKVFHGVSPVYKHSTIEDEAYRDILVITFKETD